jgi:hypothetical protein
MSLNGAVCCFFFVFLIPVMLHLKCYHGTNRIVVGIKRSLSTIGLLRPDLGMSRTKSGGALLHQNSNLKFNTEFNKNSNSNNLQKLEPLNINT